MREIVPGKSQMTFGDCPDQIHCAAWECIIDADDRIKAHRNHFARKYLCIRDPEHPRHEEFFPK